MARSWRLALLPALLIMTATHAGVAGCTNAAMGACGAIESGPGHLPMVMAFGMAAALWLVGLLVIIRQSGPGGAADGSIQGATGSH